MKEISLFSALLFVILFILLTIFEKYALKEKIKWFSNILQSLLAVGLYLLIISFIFYGEN